jgi:hypothetical protein
LVSSHGNAVSAVQAVTGWQDGSIFVALDGTIFGLLVWTLYH